MKLAKRSGIRDSVPCTSRFTGDTTSYELLPHGMHDAYACARSPHVSSNVSTTLASFPFRYENPICSSSLSITDVTYGFSNNNEIISNYDEHNYDDEKDESPKKGLLKQMFCLPLN